MLYITMKKITILVVVLVAIFGVQSATAWGGFGHGAIAYVAEQHLTPEAKAKCRYYLEHTLPYYSAWMDHWLYVEGWDKVNSGHSIRVHDDGCNIQWEGHNPEEGYMTGRAMSRLLNEFEELRDGKYKNLPDSVVRQRLINMIHYIPDMHCPVHVGFSKTVFAHYRYPLYKNGKKSHYHGFWDFSPYFERTGWTYEKFAAEVDNILPKQAKKWQKGLEKRDVKLGLELWARDIIKQAHRCYVVTPKGTDLEKMNKEQCQAIHELSDEMAMKGAYRLAYVLNSIFKE